MIRLDLTELAEQQLIRERKKPTLMNIINYTQKIRHWMDKHPEATSMIINGGTFKSKKAERDFKKKYHIGKIEGKIYHLPIITER